MRAGAPCGTVTFLFTDIEGSSAAWDRYPDEMNIALARHDAILRSEVAGASGYVFSTGGDGLAAAFATAGDALTAAVGAQRALNAEPWPDPIPIKVRMGLHTGPTVERDGDYFGPTVIRAARLMGLVGGGRVVCSAATATAAKVDVEPGVAFVPVGTVTLKGLTAAEDVFAVSAPGMFETGAAVGLMAPSVSHIPSYSGLLRGREVDLDAVMSALRTSSLTTITGPAGVGKTRLAAEACRGVRDERRDGIVWVDLASVSHDEDVAQAVADSLGVSPPPGEDPDLATRIGAALLGRSMLIVLDNCEHVVAGVLSLVRVLLAAQDSSGVLATSRERLGGSREVVVDLSPLGYLDEDGPAVRLLADRIGTATAPGTDELQKLAARLDGVPLALELAAARCRTLGVGDVIDRVSESLSLLEDVKGEVARHRSLAAALEWSYELLTDSEQQLFKALSVFAGEFDIGGARHVGAELGIDAEKTDAIVASLVDKSLISHTASRLRMLVPTRDFARRTAEADATWPDIEAAHTAYILSRCGTIHSGLQGAEEQDAIDALDSLWPDVRAVVRRSFDRDDVETIAYLVPLFSGVDAFWRRPEVFLVWGAEADVRYRNVAVAGHHNLLATGSTAAWLAMDIPLAVELAEAALAANPIPGADDCLPELSAMGPYIYAGRMAEAAEIARTCLDQATDRGDLYQQAYWAASLALALGVGGLDREQAITSGARAVRTARALGNQTMLSYALFAVAVAAFDDPEMAGAATREAHAAALAVSNRWVLLMTTAQEAGTGAGGAVEIDRLLDAVDALYRAGWVAHAWTNLGGVAPVLFRLHRDSDAAVVVGACEASDLTTFKTAELPDEARHALEHDPELVESRMLGARLSVPEVLRLLATP